MGIRPINSLRLAGFVAACAAAVIAFTQGDTVTATGIVAAALSSPGAKAG